MPEYIFLSSATDSFRHILLVRSSIVQLDACTSSIRCVSSQDDRIFRPIRRKPNILWFKIGKPDHFGRALKEGQLKERSEGVQAQWQTALGVVMAAGS